MKAPELRLYKTLDNSLPFDIIQMYNKLNRAGFPD